MPQALTDQELIKSIRSKDRKVVNDALKVLYKANFKTVEAFILQSKGDSTDASDVFQNAVLIVYEHVRSGKFLENSSLKTYLYAVSRNLWFKTLKQRSREVNIDSFPNILEEVKQQDLELSIADHHKKLTLLELLEQLGESCQELLVDFYFKNASSEDLAKKFGLANGMTAKNKKYRCMVKLMTLVKNQRIKMEDLDLEPRNADT